MTGNRNVNYLALFVLGMALLAVGIATGQTVLMGVGVLFFIIATSRSITLDQDETE